MNRVNKARGQGLLGNCDFKISDLTNGIAISWDSTSRKWTLTTHLTDAPSDGTDYVRNNGAWVAASGSSLVNTIDNGSAAELQYSSSTKLATTSTGVDITGNASVTGSVFADGNIVANDNSSGNNYFRCRGQGNGVDGGRIVLNRDDDATGGWVWATLSKNMTLYREGYSGTDYIVVTPAQGVDIGYNGSSRVKTTSAGIQVTGDIQNGSNYLHTDEQRYVASGILDGTGTLTLTSSYGCSTATDLGVGIYRVTLSESATSSNNIHVSATADDGSTALMVSIVATTTTVAFYLFDDTGTATDGIVRFQIFQTNGD